MRWSWFIIGACFLLAGSYLDNTRGTLLPALSQEMVFDYKRSGEVLVAGHFVAFAMTWLLIPALNHRSLRTVGSVTALIAIIVCLFVLRVQGIEDLVLWGAGLGGIVSVCGTISSLFVQKATTLESRSRAMSASQASYGLASFCAPLVAAAILVHPQQWRSMYLGAIPAYGVLLIACLWKAPRRVPQSEAASHHQPVSLSFAQWTMVIVMILYVAGEVLTSMWMTTWFVSKGESLQTGANYTAAFFGLMTVTRILCSFFLKSKWIKPMLWLSLVVSAAAFSIGRYFDVHWLIPCMGLLGPFFPLMLSHLSLRYPERDRTITIWVLSLMQLLVGIMHLVVGEVALKLGMDTAYWLAPIMIVMCTIMMWFARDELNLKAAS